MPLSLQPQPLPTKYSYQLWQVASSGLLTPSLFTHSSSTLVALSTLCPPEYRLLSLNRLLQIIQDRHRTDVRVAVIQGCRGLLSGIRDGKKATEGLGAFWDWCKEESEPVVRELIAGVVAEVVDTGAVKVEIEKDPLRDSLEAGPEGNKPQALEQDSNDSAAFFLNKIFGRQNL